MNGQKPDITKVFIVAHSPIVRAGLEALLQTDEKLIVAGSAPEISGALFVFPSDPTIDVVLISVEREKDVAALLDFLNDGGEDNSALPFVAVLLAPELQNVSQTHQLIRRGGVSAILPSEATGDEIAAAIKAAANNLFVAAPELLEALLSLTRESESFLANEETVLPADEQFENLTIREKEVLEMLAEGASNKMIADRLNISEHTVKFHVASVFGKLGVNSRTEAVTQALRRGLILL